LRRQWGWNDRFVVLYSGNAGLAHDFDTVLEAADRLRDNSQILFAFVSAGPQMEHIERRREDLRLPNVEIRLPVARDALCDNLGAGDVHLITLKREVPGLLVPSKIYGILAAGRPSIYVGPAEGEVFDILSSGRCGTRIGNGDAAALAQSILRYFNDGALRAQEGERAREIFEQRFTKRRAMEQFRSVLQSLTSPTASARRGT
jgi:glycosyltransferase involved in cell wall biosynthesis